MSEKPRAAFLLYLETASIPRAFVLLPGYRRSDTCARASLCVWYVPHAAAERRPRRPRREFDRRNAFLREKLGDGGTAQVGLLYATPRETVALKMTPKQVGMRWSRAVRTFEHEAALLERCVHQHVIGVRGLYQGTTDLALALELVPGDVQQLLQRHGALAEQACARSRSSLAQRWHTYIRWAFCIAT